MLHQEEFMQISRERIARVGVIVLVSALEMVLLGGWREQGHDSERKSRRL